MTEDQLPEPEPGPRREGHPVVWGAVAFVAVVAVVGGVAGGGAVVATRALGLGGDEEGNQRARVEETLSVPPLSRTPEGSPSASITLRDVPTSEPTTEYTEPEEETGITLAADSSTVAPDQTINFTGTYLGGDGAVLQIERFVDGAWTEFPVTAFVNGGSFSTYIRTSVPGATRFRVRDLDNDAVSNEVLITVA